MPKKDLPFHRLLLLVIVSVCVAACGGSSSTPESQVRAALDAMVTAAEDRSNAGVLKWISESYTDHYGHDKQHLRKIIAVQLLRNQTLSLYSFVRSLNVRGDTAELELSLAMAGRKQDLTTEAGRLDADLFKISALMQKEKGEWRVRSASWERGW